jgi:hypothetical protein
MCSSIEVGGRKYSMKMLFICKKFDYLCASQMLLCRRLTVLELPFELAKAGDELYHLFVCFSGLRSGLEHTDLRL